MSGTSAANLSSRKNTNFLDMAKRVPCCAVWDDHDFRFNNEDSIGFPAKILAKKTLLDYWGNPDPVLTSGSHPVDKIFGLTCRMSFGNVDIYIMDGRYHRDIAGGVCFGNALAWVKNDMIARNGINRLRILLSGSTWNHTETSGSQAYGNSIYMTEREAFYTELANLFGSTIKGLVFISGDIHINEIYEIVLPSGGSKKAPEIVSSPMGNNSSLKSPQPITGERKWSISSEADNWGFTSITLDTTNSTPSGNWKITVKYLKYNSGASFNTKSYTLNNDQFIY